MNNKKYTKWSQEEIEYLEEKWGNMTSEKIAKQLGRTIYAVKTKASKLNVGAFFESGNFILLKDLLIALGQYNVEDTITKFKKYNCPIRCVRTKKKVYRKIDLDEFWPWMEQHKNIISFNNFEKNSLGKEPDWVDYKRKLDKRTPKKQYRLWTTEEENLLLSKVKNGQYNLMELSIEFNRTEAAIRKKISALDSLAMPKKRISRKYTLEDEKKILQMKNAGYDYCHIARELNRSEGSIMYKCKQLCDQQNIC